MILIDPYKANAAANEWHTLLKECITVNGYKDKWTEVIAKSSDITKEEKDIGLELIKDFCDNLETYSKATKEALEQKSTNYEANIKSHQKLHQLLKHIFIRLYETFTALEVEIDNELITVAYHVRQR